MKPTNKIRWLKVQHNDSPYADMTLQQWWSQTALDEYMQEHEVKGECRDVEVQK